MITMRMEAERAEIPVSDSTGVQHLRSLEKGLRLLELFSRETPFLTMTELARRSGLHLSTIQRLTTTLCNLEYLKRDENKRYHLGLKVIKLGFQVMQTLELRTLIRPYLQDLFDVVGLTVNLFLAVDDEVVIVERLEKHRILQYNLQMGSSLPMYCTAAGKTILSFAGEKKVRNYLKRVPMKPFTPHTITDPGKFLKELTLSRKQGYAINIQELSLGACAVGMAIFDREEIPRGAISLACPAQHFKMDTVIEKYINPLRKASRIASQFMGNNKE